LITRLKNRPKGILIPTDDYTRKPIYENQYSKYIGGSIVSSDVDAIPEVGPYQKVLKNFCSVCGGAPDYKAIWQNKTPWFLKTEQYTK
jgi:hypothetical protein